jgi:hypothetical protein
MERLARACAELLLVAGCLLTAACAGVPSGSERVLDFHSDLTVREDGTLKVLEQVRLQSAGIKIKHGITQLFLKTVPDAQGRPQPFEANLLAVTRDGRAVPYDVQDTPDGRLLNIGDRQMPLPAGEHTYTIAFTTNRQVQANGARCELFWNVIASQWDFPIDAASATVELPPTVPREGLAIRAYTGGPGVKNEDVSCKVHDGGRVQFEALGSLGVREGMTIWLSWPAPKVAARP